VVLVNQGTTETLGSSRSSGGGSVAQKALGWGRGHGGYDELARVSSE